MTASKGITGLFILTTRNTHTMKRATGTLPLLTISTFMRRILRGFTFLSRRREWHGGSTEWCLLEALPEGTLLMALLSASRCRLVTPELSATASSLSLQASFSSAWPIIIQADCIMPTLAASSASCFLVEFQLITLSLSTLITAPTVSFQFILRQELALRASNTPSMRAC